MNSNKEDALDFILNETEGQGVDKSFEVVGSTPTIEIAVHSVRKGGSVVMVGNLAPKVELPLQSVVTREISLFGTCASAGEYPNCIELMINGAIQVDPLISAKAPIDEGPEWFDRLYKREPSLMKVILQP